MPAAAVLRQHKQVFEVHPRLCQERRIVVEEQREPHRRARVLGNQALAIRPCPKEVLAQSRFVEHDLIERGVPKDKILQLPQDADSTLDESLAVRHLAEQRGWKSLILVTSNYHTRRALYIFRHRLPPTISVTVASAPDGDFDPEHWWEKRISAKRFFHEFVGMLDSAWELRRPPPASSPSP